MENYINPHIKDWEQYTKKMSEAMNNNDVENSDKYKALADAAYNEYKEDADKMYSCNGFASCNEAIQEALPRLIKENSKALKDIMNTIMEDKNLTAQLLFYKTINNCSTDDTSSYINEALNLVSNKIDRKTIKESNNKIIGLVRKYGILPETKFNDEQVKMFESCEYLLTNNKKISNLNTYTNHLNALNEYVKKHKVVVSENKKESLDSLIESYNNKYMPLLNGDERSLVSEIISEETTSKRKKEIFDEIRNECLNGIETMLKESKSNDDTNELNEIRNMLNSKTYTDETFIEECAKLMQIREVLFEK